MNANRLFSTIANSCANVASCEQCIALLSVFLAALCCMVPLPTGDCRAESIAVEVFHQQIEPILTNYCYDCHGYGMAEGGMALDQFENGQDALRHRELWWKALKLLRLGIMPPSDHERPPAEQLVQLEQWIKTHVFEIDPRDPDPGHVTLRRLNRIEYRNTIRDLLGVDYNTELHFPPDDSGHGFDNIGDVLTMSPLLLEKYIAAAREIVSKAVPGQQFRPEDTENVDQPKPGPREEEHRVRSQRYRQFFPRDVPEGKAERLDFARELLGAFARRAYRRPADQATVDRLAALAEEFYSQPGQTFEAGIAEAMTAVLVSPRFLFREEATEEATEEAHPFVNEYALASRLSYFLWSTMPDDKLFRLASEQKLRENLSEQVARMTTDRRWQQFIQQFAGQWLHARDVADVDINASAVIRRDQKPDPELARLQRRFWQLRSKDRKKLTEAQRIELEEVRKNFTAASQRFEGFNLDGPLRHAMRRETEMLLEHLFREDRSLLELIDCSYTFLNERLARHYGLEGVEGDQMRLVSLPADSPRGGVLTQGTVLTTTSNPNRTSPVKRGIFILENLLGIPPAPPPPNIPPLEDKDRADGADMPTLRETLEKHRSDPMCSSCHDRMDPLGLALENFNALGLWRELDRGKPIDASGELITGQSFANVQQLKQILIEDHHRDFYRCLTEKLLILAIGRGLEYYDVQTVDCIVEKLEASGGKPSVLLTGIIESAPFQKSRRPNLSADEVPTDRVSRTKVP